MAERQTEHRLVAWLRDRLPPAASLAEAAVVAPSAAVASALRNALSIHGVPTLGVHFVTAPQLARLVCERRGVAPPTRRPDPLEERAILRKTLAQGRGGVREYALKFPSALNELAQTIREWQLRGAPAAFEAPTSRTLQEFVTIAQATTRATAHFATRRSLFAQAHAALDETRSWTSALAAVLIVDPTPAADVRTLTAALARASGVVVDRYLVPEGAPDSVYRASNPDVEAELREAAAGCLVARTRGVAWHEMVVAAPNLGAYAAHVFRAFTGEGVPFRCDAERPLALEPRAATTIHAAHVLFGEPDRANYLALLDAPNAVHPFAPDELRCFDAMSRELHLRGRGEFVLEFARHLRDGWPKIGKAPRVAKTLATWLRLTQSTPASVEACVAILREFTRTHLQPPTEATRDSLCQERIDTALDAMVAAAAIDKATAGAATNSFAADLERVIHERGMPIEGSGHDPKSVQILEYGDSLARPASHLHVLGLSEEFWPTSQSGGDTFLSETGRHALGLPSRDEQRDEQRQILDALCHHPSQSLAVTRARRRASDSRPIGPSIWLDDLPVADVAENVEATHPLTRAQRRVRHGTCPRDLALLRIALQSRDDNALAEIAGPAARLDWQHARALERFEPTSLARDGDVGPEVMADRWRESVSASRVSDFGYCPLRYLFMHELGLPLLPPEPDPCELPRNRIGNHIHHALEKVFEEVPLPIGERCMDKRDEIVGRALALLDAELAADKSPLQRDFPTVHELVEARWRLALESALVEDLTRMDEDGSRPLRSEARLAGDIAIDTECAVTFHGRADRIDRLADGSVRLIDFKTGARPANDVEWNRVLNLKKPQLAIYAELLRLDDDERLHHVTEATIRAVRPPELGIEDADDIAFEHPLAHLDEFPGGAQWHGFRESLAIMSSLRRRGAFLPDSRDRNCKYCRFRGACRRLHPPSIERVTQCADDSVRDYMALTSKREKKPLLRMHDEEGAGT